MLTVGLRKFDWLGLKRVASRTGLLTLFTAIGINAPADAGPLVTYNPGSTTHADELPLGEPVLAESIDTWNQPPTLNIDGPLKPWLDLAIHESISDPRDASAPLSAELLANLGPLRVPSLTETMPFLQPEPQDSASLTTEHAEPELVGLDSSPEKSKKQSVPEPASVVLLITGLIGLAARRRLLMKPQLAPEPVREPVVTANVANAATPNHA